uniref:Uncharacterized protein n=1 Tax=Arundo donax TaxID=35708 RepID=A0A0A9CLM6_ARUDO
MTIMQHINHLTPPIMIVNKRYYTDGRST